MNATHDPTPPDVPYASPASELLALGDEFARDDAWPDYPARFGFTAEHIPELIRLATDRALNSVGGDGPEIWAPIHAWRVLAQLRAEEAAEPLVDLLSWVEDNDFAFDELPVVFGMLGGEAMPAVRVFLADGDADLWSRAAAAEGLRRIAEAEPERRNEVVAALVERLGEFATNDPALNAFLIGELIDLHATEAAPSIERAFEEDAVDISITGDWEDVQIALGLLAHRITPRPHYHAAPRPVAGVARGQTEPRQVGNATKNKQKAARKRKMARESRKRNCRKR